MRVKHSWRVTGRVLLVIAAIAIAATQLIGTTAKAADPIKVGWVGPLSPPGGYAEGALMKQAAEIAAEELNARGGVLGRPIQVVFADTRGKPEEGTAAAERLISQEKVVAITGEFHSSVFLAEMEVAHKAGIPIIAVDVWALKITAKGYPEVFRVAPNQALIATKYGDWMAAAGFKNVAVMFEKTDGQAGRYLVTELVGLPKNAWNDKTKAFVTAFKKKYNHAPSPQAIENYDAMLVLADAIARAKSTDGKAIIAALEKTDIVLGRGRYTFSTSREPDWAYHQFMNAPVALLQFDKANQDAEDAPIIWPRDIADVKYTYLKPGQ